MAYRALLYINSVAHLFHLGLAMFVFHGAALLLIRSAALVLVGGHRLVLCVAVPLPPWACSVRLSRCCTPSHTKCCTGSRRWSPSRTLCGSSSSPAWTRTQHPRWQAVAIEPDKHRDQAQYSWNCSSCRS